MNLRVDEEFERFAARVIPALLRYAVMLSGDSDSARDLVQDVMVKAYRHWDRVASAQWPERYVKTMITREHLMARRRWSARHVFPGLNDHQQSPTVSDHADAVADRDELWQRLARLPRRQRAVLVLRYYEQLTDAEIAEVLDCSPGTVRGYASRALLTLRSDSIASPRRIEEKS